MIHSYILAFMIAVCLQTARKPPKEKSISNPNMYPTLYFSFHIFGKSLNLNRGIQIETSIPRILVFTIAVGF